MPPQTVFRYAGDRCMVFVTVGTEDRLKWLADPDVHRDLLKAWRESESWLVGKYVLMPDHLHFFCAPGQDAVELEKWVTYWKRLFRRIHADPKKKFQSHSFHHRLRAEESYSEKWNYVEQNPVRAALVKDVSEWPYRGQVHELIW